MWKRLRTRENLSFAAHWLSATSHFSLSFSFTGAQAVAFNPKMSLEIVLYIIPIFLSMTGFPPTTCWNLKVNKLLITMQNDKIVVTRSYFILRCIHTTPTSASANTCLDSWLDSAAALWSKAASDRHLKRLLLFSMRVRGMHQGGKNSCAKGGNAWKRRVQLFGNASFPPHFWRDTTRRDEKWGEKKEKRLKKTSFTLGFTQCMGGA
jgi:hypothetical protein